MAVAPEAGALLDAGLAAFRAGDSDRAAGLLALALRTGPHVAPAVIDGTIDATTPALLLVRGDAFRATGQDAGAAEAYAAAAAALGEDAMASETATPDVVPDTDPADANAT